MAVQLDPRSIKRLQKRIDLLGRDAKIASLTAANRAARSAVAFFSREVRKEVNIRAAGLKKAAVITKANYRSPVAYITVGGAHIPLVDMGARQTRKGVTVTIVKGKGRKLYRSAFMATMKSGHRGVFRRVAGKYMQKGPRAGMNGTKHSEAINEMFGPSGIGLWRHRERKIAAYGRQQLAKELSSALRNIQRRRSGT